MLTDAHKRPASPTEGGLDSPPFSKRLKLSLPGARNEAPDDSNDALQVNAGMGIIERTTSTTGGDIVREFTSASDTTEAVRTGKDGGGKAGGTEEPGAVRASGGKAGGGTEVSITGAVANMEESVRAVCGGNMEEPATDASMEESGGGTEESASDITEESTTGTSGATEEPGDASTEEPDAFRTSDASMEEPASGGKVGGNVEESATDIMEAVRASGGTEESASDATEAVRRQHGSVR